MHYWMNALNWDLGSHSHWVSGENAITTASSPRMMEQKQKTLPKEDVIMCLTFVTYVFHNIVCKEKIFQAFLQYCITLINLLLNVFVCASMWLFSLVRNKIKQLRVSMLFLFWSSSYSCTTGKVINCILLPSSGYMTQQTNAFMYSQWFLKRAESEI